MFTRIAAIVQENHPGKIHKTTRATADDNFNIRAKLAHLKPQDMLQDAGNRQHEHTNRPRNKIIEGNSQIEEIRILSNSSSASGLLSMRLLVGVASHPPPEWADTTGAMSYDFLYSALAYPFDEEPISPKTANQRHLLLSSNVLNLSRASAPTQPSSAPSTARTHPTQQTPNRRRRRQQVTPRHRFITAAQPLVRQATPFAYATCL